MTGAKAVLALKMRENDAGAGTIGDFLVNLLLRVWDLEDEFNGKKPFGNSGWKQEIYRALVRGKAIAGTLDQNGYVEGIDTEDADELIMEAIEALWP